MRPTTGNGAPRKTSVQASGSVGIPDFGPICQAPWKSGSGAAAALVEQGGELGGEVGVGGGQVWQDGA